MNKRLRIVVLFLLTGAPCLRAQERLDTLSMEVYFRQGSSSVDLTYRDNRKHLNGFIYKLDSLQRAGKRFHFLRIVGYASPEGNTEFNKRLARQRAAGVGSYLQERTSPTGLPLHYSSEEEEWRVLSERIGATDMPYRREVLDILHNTPEWIVREGRVVDGRERQLSQLYGGEAWRYMAATLFPELRCVTVYAVYSGTEQPAPRYENLSIRGNVQGDIHAADLATGRIVARGTVSGRVDGEVTSVDRASGLATVRGRVNGTARGEIEGPVSGTVTGTFSLSDDADIVVRGPIRVTDADSIRIRGDYDERTQLVVRGDVSGTVRLVDTVYVDRTFVVEKRDTVYVNRTPAPKPFYMSLRTNLLYDAALVPNIGIDFYLGRGWAAGVNWMYAWWSRDRSRKYWRTYGGELNLRRYVGRRAAEKPLTGHHIGVYGQMLTYDVETGGAGYLSKLSYGAGVEYGYSLPVGGRLNLDFSIGLGYLGGEYKKYEPMDGHYVWQKTAQRCWIGPTKAEVSLVWLLGRGNHNEKKGGNR